jgi:hypothetical protein
LQYTVKLSLTGAGDETFVRIETEGKKVYRLRYKIILFSICQKVPVGYQLTLYLATAFIILVNKFLLGQNHDLSVYLHFFFMFKYPQADVQRLFPAGLHSGQQKRRP